MIDQKKRRVKYRTGMKVLAAAALSAALLAGGVQTVMVRGGTVIEACSLIPDNVTIEEPVALSEISLPKSEYGRLSWVDDTCVPSKRVESFGVVFIPNGTADLSGVSGWDPDQGKIFGYVTVIVSSLEDKAEYEEITASEEECEPEASEEPAGEAETSPDGASSEEETPEITETPPATDETLITDNTLLTEAPQPTEEPSVTEAPQPTEAPEESADEALTASEITAEPEEGAAREGAETADILEASEQGEASESDSLEEETGASEIPGVTEMPDTAVTTEITDDPDNIFDKADEALEADDRPTAVEENVTPEEQEQLAEINHCSSGICVSGINLPWYVQFRVTAGTGYEFSNAKEAGIFKSFEFELWDLRDNTEYEIPDGEYISVTMPVKAGYEYTVEHLLDNGAKETIIPSVNGTTMVFSTHSFSPFGIAGSKPIVGGEIIDEGYKALTATPVPTKTPTVTQKPAATGKPTATQKPTVTNTAGDTVRSGSSNGNTSGSSNNSSSSAGTKAQDTGNSRYVNTGDSTQILPFVILVAAAVVIAGVVIYLKKRK